MGKVILLDNGHGVNTPGKCSPDKSIREWSYSREIVKRIYRELTNKGYDARILVPEDDDIKLSVRAGRANEVCKEVGAENVVLVSVHLNAAGNGSDWMKGRGWEVYSTKGKTNSDDLAQSIYDIAEKYLVPLGFKMRPDYSDGDADKEANFTLLYMANCPAVLTENLFQDNKEEVEFLLTEEGKQVITDIHVEGILNYINK